MLFLKWFASRSVRHAWQAANHVEKILHHQRDVLSPEAITAVQSDIDGVRVACRTGTKKDVTDALARIEKSANKWLKPYPNSALRENIEVALVAIAVAMGIRTFFLQPFKIPTGSMQPTLYGVTQEDLRGREGFAIPGRFKGFFEYWFNGVQYFHVVAKASGTLSYDPPTKFVLFNLKQAYRINGVPQPAVWFPPDDLFQRAGVFPGTPVNAGQDIVKMRVISGDHLFVDRATYNFCRPERGDVVVFETHGIDLLNRDQQDTYYIKRLCGLGGERLQLTNDYAIINISSGENPQAWAGRLVVDGRELTAGTPRFENLYSFPDATSRTNKTLVYRENHYFGHGLLRALAPGQTFQVPHNHYFVMGDNTFNSSDSRYWGDFDQSKVIGKSFFVYWPIGGTTYKGENRESRFGWSHR